MQAFIAAGSLALSVTVTTVSKHQFHLVLQCGVNNTKCTAHPQSFNRDGGTSNSTAAATFIRKSHDVSLSSPLSHPLLCPYLYLCRVLVLLFFFHVSRHSQDHICIQDSTCRVLLGHVAVSHPHICPCVPASERSHYVHYVLQTSEREVIYYFQYPWMEKRCIWALEKPRSIETR